MLAPMNARPIRLFLAAFVVFATAAVSGGAENKPSDGKVRIVLVGDSTVASKSGWGDAFAKLLRPGVECLNEAAGGRS